MDSILPTRLSSLEQIVLGMLAREENDMYGYQMVEASSGRLKRGTIYVMLGRMEEKNLISSRKETRRLGAPGLPRRLYRATSAGKRTLEEWELEGILTAPGARS